MNPPPAAGNEAPESAGSIAGRRLWHAIALLLAAAVAWLIFASYRQPDLMLDLAGMRLCANATSVIAHA